MVEGGDEGILHEEVAQELPMVDGIEIECHASRRYET
jgi:hypothetical protein